MIAANCLEFVYLLVGVPVGSIRFRSNAFYVQTSTDNVEIILSPLQDVVNNRVLRSEAHFN